MQGLLLRVTVASCATVPYKISSSCMVTLAHNALQSASQLPEAFVVLGFAFYLQPMMMPLLHDMPPGPSGLAITSAAVKIVIIGTLPQP